ncbi:MAG: hypothetical protein HYW49_12610 [Deltaproteobacteria bacterium]|nr:hypothetical protein [Deltaproteobacteria bacterium]
MKGLGQIPGQDVLETVYGRLQRSEPVSEGDYALYGQWSRFDPRLAEQLVSALARDWRRLSPVLLNEALRKQSWPAAFGVLLEYVVFHLSSSRALFPRWRECVMHGIVPASNEAFYIGTRAFGGVLAFEDAAAATKPYRKWGYFARDTLVRRMAKASTLVTSGGRLTAIESLLREKRRFTVSDYVARLGHAIHRRQAQRDLEAHPGVLRVGRTRASFYVAAGGRWRRHAR